MSVFITGCATQGYQNPGYQTSVLSTQSQSYEAAIDTTQQVWQPAYNVSAVVADNMQNAQTISAQVLAIPQQINAIANMWSGGFGGW